MIGNWVSVVVAMVMALVLGWAMPKGDAAPDQPVESTVVVLAVEYTTTTTTVPEALPEVATASSGATRLNNAELVAETIPVAPPGPPTWIEGDCESFRPVFSFFGDDGSAADFFIDGGILARETHCGVDMLNESTGDSGPCQINPIHNRTGYFGGREFGDGGWLFALHGLTTRQDLYNVEWVNACLTLFTVCGGGPWRPPYTCEGNRLP